MVRKKDLLPNIIVELARRLLRIPCIPYRVDIHFMYTRTGRLYYVLCNCRYEDTKEELDEYEASSKELEAEMEVQLEQSEKKVKDLTSHNERLQTELEQLRVSY